jgi:hypothetical protein
MARWWFLEMFGRKRALAPPRAKGRSYRPSFEVLEDRVVPATIAYAVPSGTVGSQNFGGPLGMDFDVNQPIAVTELGVFDSGSDGLSVQLGAALYNRDTQALMAQLTFAAGTTGTLIGGSRFLPLSTPLFLPAGFHGTIVAQGYAATEPDGNATSQTLTWTMNDGGGLISFVGLGRYGNASDVFPTFPAFLDTGPADRYAAGTFEFVSGMPVAVNDSYNVAVNAPLTVSAANGVLANDTIFAPAPNHAVLVGSSTGVDGTLALNANGSFTYTPLPGKVGTDTFTYHVLDSAGDVSNNATITFKIPAVSFTDNFNRTGPGLGSNWGFPSSFTSGTYPFQYRRRTAAPPVGFQLSGNQAVSAATPWQVATDQVVGVSLLNPTLQANVTVGGNQGAVGLFARARSNGDAYVARVTAAAAGTAEILLYHGATNTFTVLGSQTGVGTAGPLKFTITGGATPTLTLFVGGVQEVQVTGNTALTAPGEEGIIAWGPNGIIDNFSATGS